jgi:hypothetical protein
MSGAIVTTDPFAQQMTTGDGSTAGTTAGTTSDGGSIGDSNGAFDIALSLTDIIKKVSDTSASTVGNLK